MAEVHIIGQILKAVDFAEPHLYCKWSLQSGEFPPRSRYTCPEFN